MDFIYWSIFCFFSLMIMAILTSPLARRLGVPILLVLLGIGMLSGLTPAFLDYIQDPYIIFFVAAPALALILFDSGFQTPFTQNKNFFLPASVLASLGVLLSVLFLTPFAMILLDIPLLQAMLLASLISSTDAAAVFLLLRAKNIYLKTNVQSTLEIESGSNDPAAVFLTLTCLALIDFPLTSQTLWAGILLFLQQSILGLMGGFALFYLMRFLLNYVRLEQPLYPLMIFALVLVGFSGISLLGGSGYLTVYLSGLILGNHQIRAKAGILKFQQSLAYFAQILMFTSLGLFVSFDYLKQALGIGLILGSILIFLVRPLMVFLLLYPFPAFSFKEKAFMAFVGLRGATSLLLALILVFSSFEKAVLFFHIIFVMVLLSLLTQGLFLKPLALLFHTKRNLLAPPAVRESIDLPGLRDSFLMMYELCETSAVVQGETVPRWAQPVLLIRDKIIYQANAIRFFKPQDKVYVFVQNERTLQLLNQLYGDSVAREKTLFGTFLVSAQTPIRTLQKIYQFPLEKEFMNDTLNEFIQKKFPQAQIGDRLSLGILHFVIRDKNDKEIISIGFDIDNKY